MKPYWSNGRATLYQGHVLDALDAMEAESVHCAVTSPPYWGLRDYGLESLEWPAVSYAPMAGLPEIEIPGCDPGCEHVWGKEIPTKGQSNWNTFDDYRDDRSKTTTGAQNKGGIDSLASSHGQYCQRCGGWRGSLGLEPDPAMFVGHIVLVARALWRVLREDGTFWLNFGDSYSGSGAGGGGNRKGNEHGQHDAMAEMGRPSGNLKPKDLIGIPWRVAFALQADGWYLRSDIIWAKGVSFCPTYSGSCMPESVRDRPTKGHEYVFLLSKSKRYFYDGDAVREANVPGSAEHHRRYPYSLYDGTGKDARGHSQTGGESDMLCNPAGRNLRTVWTINPGSYREWGETSRLVRVGLDDVSDGTIYIASPSCPVHGCRDRPSGERANDEMSRTDDNGLDHAQSHPSGLVSSSKRHALCCPGYSLDSLGQVHSRAAIAHNKQTHKTGRAPETNSPCTPCAGMTSRTGDRSESLLCAAMHESMPDCNTWPDEMGVHLLDQIPYHIVDKSSLPIPPECLCGFYHKVTEKSSHFATFPPKLVEPMIKAGTSAKGCCPECGASWERVTEKNRVDTRPAEASKYGDLDTDIRSSGPGNVAFGLARRTELTTTTTGWIPTCQCDAGEPVPCTVLDPFAGTFTTGEVAIRLGRRAVGIELSQDYCDEHVIPRLSKGIQMEMAL